MRIIVLILAITFLGSCAKDKPQKLPYLGHKRIENIEVNGKIKADTLYHTISDFSFVDQDSTVITLETFNDKVYVTDFFFTTCPSICPEMATQMLRVYEEFKDNPEVVLLSHSIDPEYDTVNVLRDYADKLGVESSKWHFVTGDKKEIYEIGNLSYMVTAQEDGSAPGGFLHSGAFLLIDKEKRIRGVYDGTEPADVSELMEDIVTLLKEYQN